MGPRTSNGDRRCERGRSLNSRLACAQIALLMSRDARLDDSCYTLHYFRVSLLHVVVHLLKAT